MRATEFIFEGDNGEDKSVSKLKSALLAKKEELRAASKDQVYDTIDKIMTRIAKSYGVSGKKLHDLWVDKYTQIPDVWITTEK